MPRFPVVVPAASSAGCLFGLLVLTAPATAQIPDNHAVVSRFQGGGAGAAMGGLSVFDAATPSAPTDITGLAPELTGTSAAAGQPEGCASVLIDGRTGNLIVGEHALGGDDTDIHVLTLAGTAVVNDDVYHLGKSPTGGGWVDQMAWLGDDIVFTVRGPVLTTGPMVGELLGVLRPQLGPPGTPGTITPVPLTSTPTGFINCLAVDQQHGMAYFGMWQNNTQGDIYRVPVPGDGVTPATPVLVATIAAGILNMAIDGEGQLLVGCINGGQNLVRVDITQPSAPISTIPASFADINGLAVDNASGDLLLLQSASGGVIRRHQSGSYTFLGSVAGGASGAAIRQSLANYGAPTLNGYEWLLAPNAGGEPTIGNAGFALTQASPSAAAIGVAALTLAEASLPVFGVQILVDPSAAALSVLVPAVQSTIPLPIPNTPALAGTRVYAQCVYFEASGWAASRGLRVTLLP